MKNLKFLQQLKNPTIIFLILFLCHSYNVIGEIKQEDTIAIIDGKPILYKEVKIDKNMPSIMAKNEEEKNKIILELEKKQLSLLIIKTVEQSLIKKFNIHISPDEEKLYIKEYLKQKNIIPQINI